MDDRTQQLSRRFVLLRHEVPENAIDRLGPSHWDLMLENHGKLLTWRLPELPKGRISAAFSELGIVRLADHRIEYLDYEGPISHGRGAVRRVDTGVFHLPAKVLPDLPNPPWIELTLHGHCYRIVLQLPPSVFASHHSTSEGKIVDFSCQPDADS